jgi:hypothetical protein
MFGLTRTSEFDARDNMDLSVASVNRLDRLEDNSNQIVNYFKVGRGMKPNKSFEGSTVYSRERSRLTKERFPVASLRECRELSRQLYQVKQAVVREFGTAISGQSDLLNSALNEAEALAWQTEYPHLLFPVLAEEKAAGVTRWAARQRSVHRASRQISLGA